MNKIIVLSGPTACGKSLLAEHLHLAFPDTVIVNADSMQVYKELQILSAQPTNITQNKYALYSILNFDEHCSVGLWTNLAQKEINRIYSVGKIPIITGGSGLYIKALVDGIGNIPSITQEVKEFVRDKFSSLGKAAFHKELMSLDKTLEGKVHANDTYRMQRAMQVFHQTGKSITSFVTVKSNYDYLHIFLNPDRKILYQNCNTRFAEMLQKGAIEETKTLFEKLQNSNHQNYNIANTLGYKSLVQYISDNLSLTQATAQAQQLTRNYAKRQVTWFKNKFQNKIELPYHTSQIETLVDNAKELVKQFFA